MSPVNQLPGRLCRWWSHHKGFTLRHEKDRDHRVRVDRGR